MFTVWKMLGAGAPQDDETGQWEICTPETAAHFTAVGYLFARDLSLPVIPSASSIVRWAARGPSRGRGWSPAG